MRRPDVFTLDYSHPLASSLWMATLGENPGSSKATPSGAHSYIYGTLVNVSSSTTVSEHIGRRFFSFNGTSSKITYPSILSYENRNAFSMGAWIRTPNATKSANAVISISSFNPVLYTHDTGQVTVYWNGVRSATASPITANTWHHLMMVRGYDNVLKMFLDGKQDPATFSISNATIIPTPLIVGNDNASGWFLGDIADPMFWGRAISPAEIALLADRTDPMLGGLIVEERPVLYFDMGGSTTDELPTPTGITVTTTLASPALGQIHVLGGDGVSVTPVPGHPALAQVHVLSTPAGITVAPTLGRPALTEISNTDTLSQPDGITIAPSLGHPAIGQVHNLAAPDGITISPVLGHPALTASAGIDSLPAPDGIVISSVLGSPAIGQVHVLGGDGATVTPVLGHPLLGQVHVLSVPDGITVTPILGHPVLSAFDVAAITADEVARVVRASSRMKTVAAASRMKQVRYAVS